MDFSGLARPSFVNVAEDDLTIWIECAALQPGDSIMFIRGSRRFCDKSYALRTLHAIRVVVMTARDQGQIGVSLWRRRQNMSDAECTKDVCGLGAQPKSFVLEVIGRNAAGQGIFAIVITP